MSCCATINSPSCEVNLLRSCWTVVASDGDPTDQRVVPFEVRWVSISCQAMTSALEPESSATPSCGSEPISPRTSTRCRGGPGAAARRSAGVWLQQTEWRIPVTREPPCSAMDLATTGFAVRIPRITDAAASRGSVTATDPAAEIAGCWAGLLRSDPSPFSAAFLWAAGLLAGHGGSGSDRMMPRPSSSSGKALIDRPPRFRIPPNPPAAAPPCARDRSAWPILSDPCQFFLFPKSQPAGRPLRSSFLSLTDGEVISLGWCQWGAVRPPYRPSPGESEARGRREGERRR
jgi:hypothetical protein